MKLKKTVAMLLVVLMAAFALVSCGAPAASEEPSAPASEAQESAPAADESAATGDQTADTEGKKLGVIFYSKDDAMGAAVYATLNYAAEALGVEIQWDLGKLDPTAQITAAENLIASGCDGILCIPLSEVVTQKVAQLCQENGVYFQICFRTITDEAIKTEVEGYEYYLGECVEDEVNAAKHMVELMAEGLILPYLDVPFQHAHPRVLKAMKRPASAEKNLERIAAWRAVCPDITIRSTFITGFPGETEEEFEYLLDFLREARLDRVGCFAYSPVEGAQANALPGQLPDEVRERSEERRVGKECRSRWSPYH